MNILKKINLFRLSNRCMINSYIATIQNARILIGFDMLIKHNDELNSLICEKKEIINKEQHNQIIIKKLIEIEKNIMDNMKK